ncbi:MAG: glycosyltransferase family 39 protein [Rikenellaceae bacterium]
MKMSNYKIWLFYLIALSTVIRCIIAFTLELGGEEAYYWTFALYPKLSHLDQPPMTGWLIQLFTNNLYLNEEFFIRLTSIFIGSVNTWMVFVLGRRIKNEMTGFYAAILYTTSFYFSIIAGTLVSPDAPQSLFILLSIYFLHEGLIIKYEDCDESRTLCSISLMMAGVFVGLAMLSNFSSALIWLGVIIYISLFDRSFLKKPQLYFSILLSFLILSPVILWNIKYNLIGFRFLNKVILAFPEGLSFGRTVMASIRQIIYNNPVNIVLAFVAVFSFKRFRYLKNSQYKILISLSLPFILTGLIPLGFFSLILLSAAYLEAKYSYSSTRVKFPEILKNSFYMIFVTVLIGLVQLYSGVFNLETKISPETKIGANDITIDRYGWKKLAKEFNKLRYMDVALGNISEHAYIISNNYLSASHYDYYLARPNKISVKTIGKLEDTRKYAFTTQQMDGFKIGESAYYIESSQDKISGTTLGDSYFNRIEIAKVIYIKRLNRLVVRYTIYRFKELNTIPPKELCSVPL